MKHMHAAVYNFDNLTQIFYLIAKNILVNTAIPTSNIIFVNVFCLLLQSRHIIIWIRLKHRKGSRI